LLIPCEDATVKRSGARKSLSKSRRSMEHKEGTFKGKEGLDLYWQAWLPPQTPRATLLVMHGLAEHSGRYGNPVEYFVPKGYAAYSFDLRGHGRSSGVRCYVDHFSDYVDDLRIFHGMVHGWNPRARIFLLGHSMGATIAVAYAAVYQNELSGLILSGAVLKPGASVTRLQVVMAKALSALAPKVGVAPLDSSGISRDLAVVKAYDNDPLVYRGKVTARLGAEFIKVMQKEIPAKMPRIEIPLLVMYGSEDRLANPEGSVLVYNLAKSKDRTLKCYDGFYHEIFNDPERARVFADMEAWLTAHL